MNVFRRGRCIYPFWISVARVFQHIGALFFCCPVCSEASSSGRACCARRRRQHGLTVVVAVTPCATACADFSLK